MQVEKNIKLCNAEQAKRVYQYKNTKIKFYKNKAAIWYNSSPQSGHTTLDSTPYRQLENQAP